MKIYPIVYSICASLLVSGCTDPVEILNEKQYNYIGRNSQALFDQMGFPQEERTIAGQKLYIWRYSQPTSNTIIVPNTLYSTYVTSLTENNCVIRAFVDDNDIVSAFDMHGDYYGCEQLVNRM